MPKIKLKKNGREIEVPTGANLMQSLLNADMPVASSCGGEGVCVKCVLKIEEGMQNLSVETDLEKDLRDMNDFSRSERVSCQTSVHGDVTVDASYW